MFHLLGYAEDFIKFQPILLSEGDQLAQQQRHDLLHGGWQAAASPDHRVVGNERKLVLPDTVSEFVKQVPVLELHPDFYFNRRQCPIDHLEQDDPQRPHVYLRVLHPHLPDVVALEGRVGDRAAQHIRGGG